MTVQIQVYSMTTTEKILRLTQYALIEIRYQARMPNGQIKDIELLSDLFHNVSIALISDKTKPEDILKQIIEKSSYHQGLYCWVTNNLKAMENNPKH
ncbi:hypothetical protein NP7_11390 (plasmid) [Moraxella osloensis]|uniref:Uncharacterized protein n=2 Tax=Faucicola osloensis TaxID=34062 RepID=A0A2D2LY91_FAUOS|nr:hypothetical protein [Moraxella osloensis]ATR79956.1 hypothetical protein NP7_11390 [Moraxella osloensis]